MLSLENIVRNPAKTRSALVRRGEDPPIDQILQLDSQRKRLIQAADTDRALRNTVSKTIGREKRKPTAKEIAEMRETGDRIKYHENDLELVLTDMKAVL
ncbi:MAG TPA: hypothetical protein QF772_03735, partial [Nitrospinaceae bacterium]|nr:hypothetical protein [Nitrospinaceae bacterium]